MENWNWCINCQDKTYNDKEDYCWSCGLGKYCYPSINEPKQDANNSFMAFDIPVEFISKQEYEEQMKDFTEDSETLAWNLSAQEFFMKEKQKAVILRRKFKERQKSSGGGNS